MDPQSAPPAQLQDRQVAGRLGRNHHAERVFRAGDRQVLRMVGRHLQKHAGVRTAFVILPGRVQKPRPESQASRDMLLIADMHANLLQLFLMRVVPLDVSQRRKIIPRVQLLEMRRQNFLETAITTRGLTVEHMPQVAAWIERAVTSASRGPLDDAEVAKDLDIVAGEIRDLLTGFPMPGYVAA